MMMGEVDNQERFVFRFVFSSISIRFLDAKSEVVLMQNRWTTIDM